jgi:hypothetical protein
MRRVGAILVAWAACSLSAHAQLVDTDPDWKEAEAPPPPALRTEKLVPIDMGSSVLRWGVDPASITIGNDRVVRYVVVARGQGGAVNALYEGLRCNTSEVKLYARHAGDKWVPASGADWKPLDIRDAATRHSLAIARNGACIGHGTNRSPVEIARDLGRGADNKFRPEYR